MPRSSALFRLRIGSDARRGAQDTPGSRSLYAASISQAFDREGCLAARTSLGAPQDTVIEY